MKEGIIKAFFGWLKNLSCKSKCCSGSECACGSNQLPPVESI